jgi:hypothetical protein
MPDIAWQALYRAALVESDPVKLSGRIEAAACRFASTWSKRIPAIPASVNS